MLCYFLLKKSIEAETVKTSEVFKKTFGSLSDTVREVRNRHCFWFSSKKTLHLCCQQLEKIWVNVLRVTLGAGGGQPHWYREEDQRRRGGGSKDGDALRRISLQRRRKDRQNRRVQGDLAGGERRRSAVVSISWFSADVWGRASSLQSVETMKKEIDAGDAGPYRAPPQLRKRSDFSSKGADSDSRVFEANEWVTWHGCIFSLWMLHHSSSLTTSLSVAVPQRGNGSCSPQGFQVVPAVEGLQGQQCCI